MSEQMAKWEQLSLFSENEIEVVKPTKFCRTCRHREPWQCGGSIIHYCNARKCNRTFNGLMKVQAKRPACAAYIEISTKETKKLTRK